ncbi:MAG: hypothetical protein HYZ53_15875 [Planctomycetes bacterium]|nr:hypothetical protein [Planctomycetota bacterium]
MSGVGAPAVPRGSATVRASGGTVGASDGPAGRGLRLLLAQALEKDGLVYEAGIHGPAGERAVGSTVHRAAPR